MTDDVVIVGAARTPVGAFNGAFGSLPAHELGRVAIAESLKRAGVEGSRFRHVLHVLGGDLGDGNVVDVDLILPDQIQQQVQRPFVRF